MVKKNKLLDDYLDDLDLDDNLKKYFLLYQILATKYLRQLDLRI